MGPGDLDRKKETIMMQIALIGSGMMGRVHADAYGTLEGMKVAYVVDKNREAGEALARTWNCEYLDDVARLEGRRFDIADICLPTHLHVPTIEKVSGFCPNIVCEKPLALSADEVAQVQHLVERRGLKLMVAHVLRFWPAYERAKEYVDSGRLGKLDSVLCTRRQKAPGWSSDDWLFNEGKSGGVVFDLIAHDVDYITWLLGAPERVMGKVSRNPAGRQTHAKAELVYDGFMATVFGSWGMPSNFAGGNLSWTLEIIGSEGMVYADNRENCLVVDLEGQPEYREELPVHDTYAEELRYFVECVRQGRTPSRTDAYSVEQPLRVLRAIARASEENRLISMEEGAL